MFSGFSTVKYFVLVIGVTLREGFRAAINRPEFSSRDEPTTELRCGAVQPSSDWAYEPASRSAACTPPSHQSHSQTWVPGHQLRSLPPTGRGEHLVQCLVTAPPVPTTHCTSYNQTLHIIYSIFNTLHATVLSLLYTPTCQPPPLVKN